MSLFNHQISNKKQLSVVFIICVLSVNNTLYLNDYVICSCYYFITFEVTFCCSALMMLYTNVCITNLYLRAPEADDTIAFTWARSFQPANQAPRVLKVVAWLLLPLDIEVEGKRDTS